MKYLSPREFFERIEAEYPRATNIIKTGPGTSYVTIHDKTGSAVPLVLSATEFIKAGEALGFSWTG